MDGCMDGKKAGVGFCIRVAFWLWFEYRLFSIGWAKHPSLLVCLFVGVM